MEHVSTDSSTEDLVATVNSLVDLVEDLNDELQSSFSRIESANRQIQDLKGKLSDLMQHNGKEHAEMNGRMTDIEETVRKNIEQAEAEAEAYEEEANPSSPSITPLEKPSNMPAHEVTQHLTANQDRAQFIARDLTDYADKAPAGFVLTSKTLKTVLAAKEETRPHNQTVVRVMEFMAQFGGDDVEMRKRRGKNIVVIDEDTARRYGAKQKTHERCDGMIESGVMIQP